MAILSGVLWRMEINLVLTQKIENNCENYSWWCCNKFGSWIVNIALMLPFISAILHSRYLFAYILFFFLFSDCGFNDPSGLGLTEFHNFYLINLKTQSSLRVNRSAHSLWPNFSLKQCHDIEKKIACWEQIPVVKKVEHMFAEPKWWNLMSAQVPWIWVRGFGCRGLQ